MMRLAIRPAKSLSNQPTGWRRTCRCARQRIIVPKLVMIVLCNRLTEPPATRGRSNSTISATTVSSPQCAARKRAGVGPVNRRRARGPREATHTLAEGAHVLGVRRGRLVRSLLDGEPPLTLRDDARRKGLGGLEEDERLDLVGLRHHVEGLGRTRTQAEARQVREVARQRLGVARDVHDEGRLRSCQRVANRGAHAAARRVHDHDVEAALGDERLGSVERDRAEAIVDACALGRGARELDGGEEALHRGDVCALAREAERERARACEQLEDAQAPATRGPWQRGDTRRDAIVEGGGHLSVGLHGRAVRCEKRRRRSDAIEARARATETVGAQRTRRAVVLGDRERDAQGSTSIGADRVEERALHRVELLARRHTPSLVGEGDQDARGLARTVAERLAQIDPSEAPTREQRRGRPPRAHRSDDAGDGRSEHGAHVEIDDIVSAARVEADSPFAIHHPLRARAVVVARADRWARRDLEGLRGLEAREGSLDAIALARELFGHPERDRRTARAA